MYLKRQQRKTRRGWEVIARRLGQVSVASVGVAAGIAGTTVLAQNAQNAGGPHDERPAASVAVPFNEAAGEPQTGAQRRFEIPAGQLITALELYKTTTGVSLQLSIPADQLTGFRTAGAAGVLSDAEALRQLLANTGLSFHFDSAQRAEIAVRNAEHVEVTTSVAQVGLQQFQEPLLDTAQTVNVVPQYILQEQAVTGLRDSLRNVPGISIAAGEGGAQGDNLTIRGFSARNDIFLDGIRDFGSYYRDAFNYASVDVLEGPASVEFGRGSTGGIVNQESKTPGLQDFVGGNVQLGTNLMRRVTIDVNKPIEQVPGGTAFRLNLAAMQTKVSERDVTEVRRFGIAPSLAFGLNTKTRATLSYLHEGEDTTPDYGLPYFGAGVAAVPRSTFYGFAADNYLRTSPDVVTAKVDHDFGLHVTVRNTLRWGNYPRDVRITEPQINTAATNPATVALGAAIRVQCAITAAAATSCYPLNTPLSAVAVRRNQLTAKSVEDILWDQMSLTARFTVARVENSAVVLVEGGRERSNPLRNAYTVPYVAALNPNPNDAFAPTATTLAVTTHVASQSYGIQFLDTLKLTSWLQASGGVRFDSFSTSSRTPVNPNVTPNTPAAAADRLDKQPTYRAALVAKPRPNGSIYFDWGTSFNPAAESLSLSANNATSPPEYNETFELGAKWSFLHDRLSLNSSVFRTEKLNARETDPNNSNNTINAGNQLVRGFQIGTLGHMPRSFDVIAGYAYLDGRVESSILNASPFASINLLLIKAGDPRANTAPYFLNPAGFALANVPKNSGNLWVTHAVRWGVIGGIGGSYVGARRASSTSMIGLYNSSTAVDPANVPLAFKAIPSYTLLNLMVRRPLTDHLDLQANILNFTNRFFIDQPHPNHLVPGEGINTQFGLSYKF